jgi:hypothetical protein
MNIRLFEGTKKTRKKCLCKINPENSGHRLALLVMRFMRRVKTFVRRKGELGEFYV